MSSGLKLCFLLFKLSYKEARVRVCIHVCAHVCVRVLGENYKDLPEILLVTERSLTK